MNEEDEPEGIPQPVGGNLTAGHLPPKLILTPKPVTIISHITKTRKRNRIESSTGNNV